MKKLMKLGTLGMLLSCCLLEGFGMNFAGIQAMNQNAAQNHMALNGISPEAFGFNISPNTNEANAVSNIINAVNALGGDVNRATSLFNDNNITMALRMLILNNTDLFKNVPFLLGGQADFMNLGNAAVEQYKDRLKVRYDTENEDVLNAVGNSIVHGINPVNLSQEDMTKFNQIINAERRVETFDPALSILLIIAKI